MPISPKKRLFFAAEVTAPWPSDLPSGRVLDPDFRHLTLAFLGDIDYDVLKPLLPAIPRLEQPVGQTGFFDRCLLLPSQRPTVIAWRVAWFDDALLRYQKRLAIWLRVHGYHLKERPFLSHVTVARFPAVKNKWLNSFTALPMMTKALHLYESIGNLTYKPIWSMNWLPPIEEIDHTADVAFLLRAPTLTALHWNARTALAFKFPPLLQYFDEDPIGETVEEMVEQLNGIIARADGDIGCPFKAVSLSGEILSVDGLYQWEMIVDV